MAADAADAKTPAEAFKARYADYATGIERADAEIAAYRHAEAMAEG